MLYVIINKILILVSGLGFIIQFNYNMDEIYENFYSDDDRCFSDEADDFMGLPIQFQKHLNGTTKNDKSALNTLSTAQMTINTKTTPNNLTDLRANFQISIYKNNNQQNSSVQKQQIQFQNFKNNVKIDVNLYHLSKIVESYRGQRLQTMNLNKYYCICVRDFLYHLKIYRVLKQQEFCNFQENLNKNTFSFLQSSPSLLGEIEKYMESKNIISKILISNKMNFNNKLRAIKYIQSFSDKLFGRKPDKQGWKTNYRRLTIRNDITNKN